MVLQPGRARARARSRSVDMGRFSVVLSRNAAIAVLLGSARPMTAVPAMTAVTHEVQPYEGCPEQEPRPVVHHPIHRSFLDLSLERSVRTPAWPKSCQDRSDEPYDAVDPDSLQNRSGSRRSASGAAAFEAPGPGRRRTDKSGLWHLTGVMTFEIDRRRFLARDFIGRRDIVPPTRPRDCRAFGIKHACVFQPPPVSQPERRC